MGFLMPKSIPWKLEKEREIDRQTDKQIEIGRETPRSFSYTVYDSIANIHLNLT